jgi:hypothetical protein
VVDDDAAEVEYGILPLFAAKGGQIETTAGVKPVNVLANGGNLRYI